MQLCEWVFGMHERTLSVYLQAEQRSLAIKTTLTHRDEIFLQLIAIWRSSTHG